MAAKPLHLWRLDVPEGCPIKHLAVDNFGGVHVVWDGPTEVSFAEKDVSLTMLSVVLESLTVSARSQESQLETAEQAMERFFKKVTCRACDATIMYGPEAVLQDKHDVYDCVKCPECSTGYGYIRRE